MPPRRRGAAEGAVGADAPAWPGALPLSERESPRGRILGIDLGAARIGLALSDPLGLTAQGLPTLEHVDDPLRAIALLIREHEVGLVILGHPINMDGTRGRAARTVEAFAAALREAAGIPVELADERLTTDAAHRALAAGGVSGKRRKAHVDRLAAQLILQSYLDRPR